MKKLSVAAGVALALSAGSAFAADLPSVKAAPVVAPPAFSWTGLYGGINAGYGFSNGNLQGGSVNEIPSNRLVARWDGTQAVNGVIGGFQIGYNYQVNPLFVVGVEADIQGTGMNSSRNYTPYGIGYPGDRISVQASNSLDWFGTARARVGVTVPGYSNFLVYGTGGFAYGRVSNNVSFADFWANSSANGYSGRSNYFNTNVGWTAGGGVEWSPLSFPSWSFKAEYLYTDLGSVKQTITSNYTTVPGTGFVGNQSSPTAFHSIRAGVNWHFNPFAASAPVLAKY